MDLQELHEKTGISRRKLRYCLDHSLIPGLSIEIASDEVGRPRKFHEDVGFAIACAASLLEMGLPHERIRFFLDSLRRIEIGGKGRGKSALVWILEFKSPAIAQLSADGFVRLTVEQFDYDSGWTSSAGEKAPRRDYSPLVAVVLDLGQILRQVFGG